MKGIRSLLEGMGLVKTEEAKEVPLKEIAKRAVKRHFKQNIEGPNITSTDGPTAYFAFANAPDGGCMVEISAEVVTVWQEDNVLVRYTKQELSKGS